MKKQLKSFRHALEGIGSAVKSEVHMRFHLVAAVYVFYFAYLGDFTFEQWAILAVTVAVVIAAELVNTAVERLCDLYTTEENKHIKFIKDVSAGAVLVCAIGAAVVAVLLFLCTGKLADGVRCLISNIPLLIITLLSAVLSVLFVIRGDRLFRHKNK